MLVSCGTLGLDWGQTSLSMFLEACEAHNASTDPKNDTTPADPEFRDFMKKQFARG